MTRMIPPFYPYTATCEHDWSSRAGAEMLAGIIRSAWARVGVHADVQVMAVERRRRDETHWTARLDMLGGVPPRAVPGLRIVRKAA